MVLATGANKGIGFEVSRKFATRRLYSFAESARHGTRGKAAKTLRDEGLDVRFVVADLNGAVKSGAGLAKQISEESGHLDVLVNNAGIADREDGACRQRRHRDTAAPFEANFFGTVAITQPLLRAAESARIVNVPSGLGSLAINADPSTPFYHVKILGYNASKAALNMFTIDLAYDLRDTKIKVNSVSPGYVATDINNHAGTDTVEEGAIAIVRLAQLPDDGPTGSFTHKNAHIPGSHTGS